MAMSVPGDERKIKDSPGTPSISPDRKLHFHVSEFGHRASLGILDEAVAVKDPCVGVLALVAHDGAHGDTGDIAHFHEEPVAEGIRGDGLPAQRDWDGCQQTKRRVATRGLVVAFGHSLESEGLNRADSLRKLSSRNIFSKGSPVSFSRKRETISSRNGSMYSVCLHRS